MNTKQHFKSLREYIAALQACGELQPIAEPVDLDLEIGAICRRCYETGAPAPLFENIRGMPRGHRVLGAPAGVSSRKGQYLARIAVSLGLPPTSTGQNIIAALVEARACPGIPPRVVETGPCKENVVLGDDVDLNRLPVPLLHGGDGGRFINTYGLFCVQTPDRTWTNWSIARAMIVDAKRMAGIVAPNQHIGMIRQTWLDRGEPMPFVLALGTEPFLPFVGGMPLPEYLNEVDFAGAYFGEPIEVVRAETVDLLVPATAEIVVEGHLSMTETAVEGPMGEYAGYLWSGPGSPKPVYQVSAITHRNEPILPVSVAGEPTEENHTAWGVPNAAEIVHFLREAGLPIAMAWSPFESANHWYVISVERDWRTLTGMKAADLCQRIGDVLFQSKAGMGTPKYLVVANDIDITQVREVVWAFATRNQPGPLGELLFDHESTNPLVAYLSKAEKMNLQTTKVIYNCLPPDEMKNMPLRSSFAGTYPTDLQARVLANWTRYGFPADDGHSLVQPFHYTPLN